MEKRYYIAYGSNLNIAQMRVRCPQARIIGTSEIKDYELLFTVPLSKQQEIFALGVDVIGHVTAAGTGAMLVTPDGSEIALKAPGWK